MTISGKRPRQSEKTHTKTNQKNKHNVELQRTAPGIKDPGPFSLQRYKHFKNIYVCMLCSSGRSSSYAGHTPDSLLSGRSDFNHQRKSPGRRAGDS